MRKPLPASQIRTPAIPRKRVLVMVGTEYAYNRAILGGVGDYQDHQGRWEYLFETAIHPDPVQRGGVDGMIVELRDAATHAAVRRASVPVVTVAGAPDIDGTVAVTHDNHAVGMMAANHLADLGLHQLAFVTHSADAFAQHRRDGFVAGCAGRRIKCILPERPFAGSRYEASLAAFLRKLPRPVGIFAATDRNAFDVARVCKQLAISIPEEVALLGVDNDVEICRLSNPPLSSIDHGSRRVGYEAAKLLDRWMATGKRPAGPIAVPPAGVIARRSTDLLAVDDPDVAAAIRFIRQNAGDALKVGDVLRFVAISRRTLEIRFRRAIGRSIHDEITRVRMDRARHLLISSDWTMPHIAAACGFPFSSQFSNAFKKQNGMAPVAFRNQFRYRKSD